jgi:hypothetical protein
VAPTAWPGSWRVTDCRRSAVNSESGPSRAPFGAVLPPPSLHLFFVHLHSGSTAANPGRRPGGPWASCLHFARGRQRQGSGSLSSSTNLKSLGVQIDCEQPNTIKPLARWRVVPAVVKSNHITWSGRSARNERDGAPTCPANIASYNKEQAS